MGFWSGLGNILKKAAPIATAFIPGVGPLASALISAGANAATTKLSGGSWGDALKSGAVGAATSALPIKGIGPSSTSGLGKFAGGVLGQGGGGWQGTLGKIVGQNVGPSLSNSRGLPDYAMSLAGNSPSSSGWSDISGNSSVGSSPNYSSGTGSPASYNPDIGNAINTGRMMEQSRRRRLGIGY